VLISAATAKPNLLGLVARRFDPIGFPAYPRSLAAPIWKGNSASLITGHHAVPLPSALGPTFNQPELLERAQPGRGCSGV